MTNPESHRSQVPTPPEQSNQLSGHASHEVDVESTNPGLQAIQSVAEPDTQSMQLSTKQVSSTQVFESSTNPLFHLTQVFLSALQSFQLFTTQASPHAPDDNS